MKEVSQTGGLMLSLYRHFLTAQLAATSLAINNAPLVDIANARGRPPTRQVYIGAHAES